MARDAISDPRYAALARLPGSGWRTDELVTPGRAAGYYDVGSGDSQSAQWFDETPETRTSRREYDIWNVLGGRENTPFQSKYFEGVEEADNGNLLIARGLQRPGEHKYNTFDAVWQKDPATGDYVLIDVEDTKEKASWKKHGAGIAKVAAGLGTMYLGGMGLQALGVPGAGAGALPAGAAGTGATTAEQIALMAANGMTDAEIAAVVGGQAGTDLLGSGAGALAADAGTTAAGDAAKAALYSNAGYGPAMTGAQTAAFDTVLGATGSTAAAKIASDISGVLDVIPGIKDFVDGSKIFNPGGGGGGLNLRDLLGLFGAGMQQWNIEKVAKDQRDWIDAKETAARQRRAPVRGTAGVLRVVGG